MSYMSAPSSPIPRTLAASVRTPILSEAFMTRDRSHRLDRHLPVIRSIMLAGLAMITACGGNQEEVAPDSVALAHPAPALAATDEADSALRRRLRDPSVADSASRDVVARILAGSPLPPPDTAPPSTEPVYIDEGACPGECCALGRWGAKATV